MSRPITCELSRGDPSPYLAVINTSWRIMHIWIMRKWLATRRPSVQSLDAAEGGRAMACSNHCCIKITSFMTVLGQPPYGCRASGKINKTLRTRSDSSPAVPSDLLSDTDGDEARPKDGPTPPQTLPQFCFTWPGHD